MSNHSEGEPKYFAANSKADDTWHLDLQSNELRQTSAPDQKYGTKLIGVLHPLDTGRVQALVHATRTTSEPAPTLNTEFRLIGTQRQVRHFAVHGVLRHLPSGRADGVFIQGHLRDITAEKQATPGVNYAETVFCHTQNSIVVTDPLSFIEACNPAFTRITGYEPDEVRGHHIGTLKSGLQDASFYRQMWRDLVHEGHWTGELINRRKNGEVYSAWLTISAVLGPDGAPLHYIGIFADISKLKEEQRRLEFLADHDTLTGLPNRRLFTEILQYAIGRSKRDGRLGAVLFIDLDEFKAVNDTLGHDAGDELIKKVGKRLASRLRDADVLARWGGDEFVLLLENLHFEDDVTELAHQILARLARPIQINGRAIKTTASIGIAMFPSAADAKTLIAQADAAMYAAKANGRNKFTLHHDTAND